MKNRNSMWNNLCYSWKKEPFMFPDCSEDDSIWNKGILWHYFQLLFWQLKYVNQEIMTWRKYIVWSSYQYSIAKFLLRWEHFTSILNFWSFTSIIWKTSLSLLFQNHPFWKKRNHLTEEVLVTLVVTQSNRMAEKFARKYKESKIK